MDYTLNQFNGYLHLALKRQREQRRWDVIATATASAGVEALQKLLKGLSDDR